MTIIRYLKMGLFLLSGIMPIAYAELGALPLHIYGILLDQGCDVSPASTNQSIHIGDFNISDYTTVGSVSPEKDLSIVVTACAYSYVSSQVYFSGEPDENDPNLLKLSGDSANGNTASGIAVQILDSSLKEIPLNSPSAWTFAHKTEETTLHFKLRYKSTSVNVKGGDASAVLYFDVNYQ